MKPLPPKHTCPECATEHYDRAGLRALNRHHGTCVECGAPCGDDYMVLPDVWSAAGMSYHGGVLHLSCLERRLGRHLTLFDFPSKPPINALLFLGFLWGQAAE